MSSPWESDDNIGGGNLDDYMDDMDNMDDIGSAFNNYGGSDDVDYDINIQDGYDLSNLEKNKEGSSNDVDVGGKNFSQSAIAKIGIIIGFVIVAVILLIVRFASTPRGVEQQVEQQVYQQQYEQQQPVQQQVQQQQPVQQVVQQPTQVVEQPVQVQTDISKSDWIEISDKYLTFENVVQSTFTVETVKRYAKTNGDETNVKAIAVGSITGLTGKYELEVPYQGSEKLVSGMVLKVEYSYMVTNTKRVVNNIKFI